MVKLWLYTMAFRWLKTVSYQWDIKWDNIPRLLEQSCHPVFRCASTNPTMPSTWVIRITCCQAEACEQITATENKAMAEPAIDTWQQMVLNLNYMVLIGFGSITSITIYDSKNWTSIDNWAATNTHIQSKRVLVAISIKQISAQSRSNRPERINPTNYVFHAHLTITMSMMSPSGVVKTC